ncbi:2-hydroxyacid dehydrogenase [Acuticoccus yangtzensis]|uniref:2-hydroxyacid dehydrogenase n=1 Tax=Acuticoccus yangtzensis TaxID=1443441 RepID=UPI000A88A3F8|nr:glyoxylate/hydroxypyruvate reductase A [Acuticoccus yangtzensis]
MSETIPFFNRMGDEERAAWTGALRSVLPGHTIAAPAEMSDEAAAAARVAIVANPDPAEMARFTGLVWVQSVWAGVERMVGTLPERIGIVRLVDPVLGEAMAEGVLTHTLYLHRRVPEYLAFQRQGVWRQLDHPRASRRTVAILGLGELGRACAATLTGQGFKVIGWSRSARSVPGVDCRHGDAALPLVLAEADIVVVLVPLTEATRGLLSARMLSYCKAGAGLINVARGPIVDRTALLAALDSGRIGHAVLDVFDTEPLPADDPFWSHPKVTVMPHVAAITDMESASAIVAANLAAFFADGTVPPTVDAARGY